MCNSSRSLDWLMKKFGACLIVGVLGAFMSTEMVFAEKVPPVESILDEVLELVASLTKVGDEDRLVEIAIRQAKVRSCEKARDIFRTTIDSREARAVKEKADYWRFDLPIGFLHGLVEVQRRAGCVEEMKYTAQRLIALYQQRNQKHLARSAGNKLAVARYKLELELDLGSLYLSMGDVESVRSLPQGILSSVRSLPQSVLSSVRTEEWSPGFEFRSAARSAAVFLARMGHDAEALEVVSLYDMFYDARPTVAEEDDNLHHWITRVSMLAEVAEA